MAKALLWKQGVENMVSKKTAKVRISTASSSFRATKYDFILLAKRAGLNGWKAAVHSTIDKSVRNFAVDSLAVGMVFNMTKCELRRAARLI